MIHIRWLEKLAPSSSPTDALLRMMEAQNYPLDKQVETLQMLGRNDAASVLEEHLGSSRETSTRYEDTDLSGRKHVG